MDDKEKIKKLKEALLFYADPGSYFAIGFLSDAPCGDFINDFSTIPGSYYNDIARPGKLAREILLETY